MKAVKAEVRTSTYPLHLEEPPRFITFPVLRMHLLIQDPVTPCSTGTRERHHRPVCRCLTYSSSDDDDDDDTPTNEIPSPDSTPPVQHHVDAFQQPSSKYTLNVYINLEEEEEEEDFQTVPLDDAHWDMEEIPDRHLCIQKHSLLCPYPCPNSDYQASSYYDTLDLSNISELEDLMTTSSNEDIPALKDVEYWMN